MTEKIAHLEEGMGLILKEIREHRNEFKLHADEFQEHREHANAAIGKVNDMHEIIAAVGKNIGFLSKLEKLETIDSTLQNLNTNMVGPATDRNLIPKEVFKEVLQKVINIAGMIIFALLIVIVFLLTGIKFGWIAGH